MSHELLISAVCITGVLQVPTTTPGGQAGYCLGTGEVCPVCDPAATAAYKAIRRYRRQQGELGRKIEFY